MAFANQLIRLFVQSYSFKKERILERQERFYEQGYTDIIYVLGSKISNNTLTLKKLAEERLLLFDEELMTFAMGNCITIEDTNGNRKLLKRRREQKIDNVSAMMDAYVAWKANKDAFE